LLGVAKEALADALDSCAVTRGQLRKGRGLAVERPRYQVLVRWLRHATRESLECKGATHT
ncbi:MAG: hypothetical protein ACXU9H_06795, partial [Candidatus Binataceae bacterium]